MNHRRSHFYKWLHEALERWRRSRRKEDTEQEIRGVCRCWLTRSRGQNLKLEDGGWYLLFSAIISSVCECKYIQVHYRPLNALMHSWKERDLWRGIRLLNPTLWTFKEQYIIYSAIRSLFSIWNPRKVNTHLIFSLLLISATVMPNIYYTNC